MRMLLTLFAIFVFAGCSQQAEPQAANNDAGCLVDIAFDSDAQRVAFLRDNAQTIVDVTSTGAALLASATNSPELKIFADHSCADFRGSHLGLTIAPETIAATTDSTLTEASQRIGGFSYANVPFDQNTPAKCVARISPVPHDRSAEVMNVLATSGLRTYLVSGSNDGLFGSYAETCDLVRAHVQPAVSLAGVAWPAPVFCANLSLSQCGYSGDVQIGQPD